MAPLIYRVRSAPAPNEYYARRHPTGVSMETDANDCWLPHTNCPGCGGLRISGDRDLPESLHLAQDHPLMKRLRASWRRRLNQGRATNTRPFPSESWEEYQSILAQVREVLSLPPERPLAPCMQLGPWPFRVVLKYLPDVELVQGDHLVASGRFIAWLEQAGITGWAAEPTSLRFERKRPDPAPEMFRLRITGRAGKPANAPAPQDCPMCGGRYRSGDRPPDLLELDERAWDGSGIFRFWGFETDIFVTEAVRSAILAAGFDTVAFKAQAPDSP